MKNSRKKCLLKGISRANKVNTKVVDSLTASRKASGLKKKKWFIKEYREVQYGVQQENKEREKMKIK